MFPFWVVILAIIVGMFVGIVVMVILGWFYSAKEMKRYDYGEIASMEIMRAQNSEDNGG